MNPTVYWKPRGSQTVWRGEGLGSEGETLFGGQAFSDNICQGVWADFPNSLFFSPTLLTKEPWEPSEPDFKLPKLISRHDTPSFDQWWMMVNDALEKIAKDQFRKVVLARQTTLKFDGKVDPFQVLNLLMPLGDQTSLFLLQLDKENAFVGATPETLFSRKGRTLSSEAIAGTKDPQEHWSRKELSEIDAVQLFLQNTLLQCCEDFQWQPPQEKPFGTIQHLYQRIEGHLKEQVTDKQLLQLLHPTPALGGFPQKEAVHYLKTVEPFSRGWYGSPFGMISPQETEIAVAIRCALIRGTEIYLFAGAGIVAGSKPDKEWEELERKIGHFMRKL
jgi:menaquinone-specific isochorismate synthase